MKTLTQSANQTFTKAMNTLRSFMPPSQLATIRAFARGEEGQFFVAKAIETADRISSMPATYATEGEADPTAFLHYFRGGCDFYITERDVDLDGEGQHQAFGLSDIGYGPELGYISTAELIENRLELDLHFSPRPLSQIRKA